MANQSQEGLSQSGEMGSGADFYRNLGSEREVREANLRVGESRDFSDSMQHMLAERFDGQREPYDIQAAQRLLAERGIEGVDAKSLPPKVITEKFDEEDWARISASDNPMLEVWSRSNLRSQEMWLGKNAPSSKLVRFRDEVMLKSLPLLHGTSMAAIVAAAERGEILSNRRLSETGFDVTTLEGGTNANDRELGLDDFVFADFGRPSKRRSDQPEVTVVLRPEALQRPGAFATEDDVQDSLTFERSGVETDYERYMSGCATPEDFYKIAQLRIYNETYSGLEGLGAETRKERKVSEFVAGEDGGGADFFGGKSFSTWEVKIPQAASMEMVDRLIFRDEEQMRLFRAQFGERFACVYEPNLGRRLDGSGSPRHLRALGVEEVFAANYAAAVDDNYRHRQELLADIPESEREVEYVAWPPDQEVEDLGVKIDPAFIEGRGYASPEALLASYRMDRFRGVLGSGVFDKEVLARRFGALKAAKVVGKGEARIVEEITTEQVLADDLLSPNATWDDYTSRYGS